MKIGPITFGESKPRQMAPTVIQFASPALTKPTWTEKGGTGNTIWSGQLSVGSSDAEYNVEWQYPNAYKLIDRMRRSDGTVKLGLATIKLPLLRAEYKVTPASDDPRDKEIADFVEYDLHHMSTSWRATLASILLYLDFGAMPFEIVWEPGEDGKVHLRKLAPRLPRTIYRWYVADDGGLDQIEQRFLRDGEQVIVNIPIEKLAVFVNEKEGAEWRGVSILRAAYQHWFYKTGFYKIDAIAKEKRGVGVDVGTIKESASEPEKLKVAIEAVLQLQHAHENNYVVEKEDDWEYSVRGIDGSLVDMLPSIDHHDLLILRAMMADFQSLGSKGDRGSFALSRDRSSYALMALETIADHICEVMSDYVIRKLVDYNFADVKEYPKLTCGRLDDRNVTEFATALAAVINAKALTPSENVEEVVRETLGLEPLEDDLAKIREEQRRQPPPTPPSFPQPGDPNPPNNPQDRTNPNDPNNPPPPPQRTRAQRFAREPRTDREREVRFDRMAADLDKAEDTIEAALLKAWHDSITAVLNGGPTSFANAAAAMTAELAALHERGRREVGNELGIQGVSFASVGDDDAQVIEDRAALEARALAATRSLGHRLTDTYAMNALDKADPAYARATLEALSLAPVKSMASLYTSEALNMGRVLAAKKAKAKIATRSALMDGNTCARCAELDGKEVEVDSEAYDEYRPPAKCQGRGNCRCVYVYDA